ncbi:MAG: metallophosphoesterase family protein [Promethearchaeota archaeon]
MSDNHLGYRQYGLFLREQDYYRTFNEQIKKILELKPDFVVHTGDLFEFSRPPTTALLEVQTALKKLKEKNIPVYVIPGNHDSVARMYVKPPHILFKDFNLKILTLNNPFILHEDVFIGGVPYLPRYYKDHLINKIKEIKERALKYSKRILMLHQAVDKFLKINYELEMGDIPKEFDYYAMGHIHNRILMNYGRGKFAYAGSSNVWRRDEFDNYEEKGKGFYLVDLDGDVPDVQAINFESPRRILKVEISDESVDDDARKILKSIQGLEEKPLLYLNVHAREFNLNTVNTKIQNILSEYALLIKTKNFIQTSSGKRKLPEELTTIPNFLRKYCSDVEDLQKISKQFEKPEKFYDLIIGLYNTLSTDDSEEAIKICRSAYEGFK